MVAGPTVLVSPVLDRTNTGDEVIDLRRADETEVDADALVRTIIDQYAPAMYRVAMSIVRDGALAEDVVQESVMKAWQSAASFRGDSSLKSWAVRIAHNTAISTLRKRREELRDPALMPEQASAMTLDRQVQGKMMVDQMWAALADMDELTKTIVVLRELESMSYEEIAQTLDLPLPTVKTRLFRARRLLSIALKEWE